MKKYFLSFCDTKLANTLERIRLQAENMNVFDHILCLNEKYLDKDFLEKHGEFIKNNRRGYGYWIWKSYFVLKTLKSMKDNDVLVYADGGCTINNKGIKRLNEYFEIVQKSQLGILSFGMGFLEKEWSKMDLFIELGCQNEEMMNSGQLVATAFIVKKCDHVIKIFEKVYEICQKQNYHLLDDTPSIAPNVSTFREHRHDQSILSIIRKLYGTELIDDETSFLEQHPIWCTRLKY